MGFKYFTYRSFCLLIVEILNNVIGTLWVFVNINKTNKLIGKYWKRPLKSSFRRIAVFPNLFSDKFYIVFYTSYCLYEYLTSMSLADVSSNIRMGWQNLHPDVFGNLILSVAADKKPIIGKSSLILLTGPFPFNFD